MYKILVVDDEKNIADGVCYTIEENFGEEVIVNACYGIESAKNFILQNVVDILVCDINMPKQSGLDFGEQLLKDYPSLKIIFLTGYNDFSYTYKALKMPDVSYVLKLENDDVLLNEISKKMQLIANNRKAKRELLVEKAKNRALEWELEKLKLENTVFSENSFEFCNKTLLLASFQSKKITFEEIYLYLSDIFDENSFVLPIEGNFVLAISSNENLNVITEKCKRLQQALFEFNEIPSFFLLSKVSEQNDYLRYNQLLKALKNFSSKDDLYFCNVDEINDFSAVQENRDDLIIERIVNYINCNLSENLSLVILAELVYYNPAYLSRKFKQVTGVNLKDYILDKRIALAKKLLTESNEFIKDISEKCGFGNPTQFGIVFMKKVGTSPTNYRLKKQ